ncbi:MAG: hypothetical protein ACRDNY_10095, partial [Gaiellaceae bacterium]
MTARRRKEALSGHPGHVQPEAAPEDVDGGPGDKASHGPSATLEEKLAAAEAQREEYLELAQRVQADFENYRKR